MKSPVAMELNEGQVAESSEEPEEGEIIDDFDVVSDDSITFSPQKRGKFIEDNSTGLRALSLSSLTDLEVVVDGRQVSPVRSSHHARAKVKRKRQQVQSGNIVPRLPVLELEDVSPSLSDSSSLSPDRRIKKKRHLHHHKHTRKRRKIHSHRLSVELASDSDEEVLRERLKKQLRAAISTDFEESHKNKKLKSQLKAAISIDIQESHKSTLQNRLLAMIKKDVNSSELSGELKTADDIIDDSLLKEIDAHETSQSSEEPNGDEIEQEDSELIELRLEALKTALKNKYKNKKQKNEIVLSDTGADTNKENTNSNELENANLNSPESKMQETNDNVPQSPEEDEDVLRALLLASMSNKMTKKAAELNQKIIPIKKTIVNAKNTKLVNKATVNTQKTKANVNIQPFKGNTLKNIGKSNFANKNDKKLDNRLQNLPKVKPLIININSDSDTEDDLFSTQNLAKLGDENDKVASTEKMSLVADIKPELKVSTKNTPGDIQTDKITENVPKLNITPELKTDVINKDFAKDTQMVPCPVSQTDAGTETNLKPESSSMEITVEQSPIENCDKDIENKNKALVVTSSSVIECSVEKFLREQRAKVDAEKAAEESKKIIITRDVNNDELIVGTKPPVIDVTNAQGFSISPKNLNNIVITRNLTNDAKIVGLTPTKVSIKAPNSAVKLLPKNKQIEYQKLLAKLKNAEKKKMQVKKPRVRKPSQRLSTSETNNNSTIVYKTITPNVAKSKANKLQVESDSSPSTKTVDADEIVLTSAGSSPGSGESNRILEERKSDALLLHNTLKEMQQKVIGRVQIQEKYNCLKPLMKKINEVSKEQKHWNQQVKRLLDELAEAKKNQEKVHHEMTSSVKLLVERKAQIDCNNVSSSMSPLRHCPPTNTTSFPTLSTVTSNSVKKIHALNKKENALANIGVSPIAANQRTLMMSPKRIIDLADGKGNTTSDSDLNTGDPNDIEMIICKANKKKIAPVLFNKNRQNLLKKVTSPTKVVKYPNRTIIHKINKEGKLNPKRVHSQTKINNTTNPVVKKVSKTAKTNPSPQTVKSSSLVHKMEVSVKNNSTPTSTSTTNIKITKAQNVIEIKKSTNELMTLNKKNIDATKTTHKKVVKEPIKDCKIFEEKELHSDLSVVDTKKDLENKEVKSAVGVERGVDTHTDNNTVKEYAPSSKFRYISPLDHFKRPDVINPYSVMCPFEVDGTCKDPECSYKHFLPK